MTTLSRKKNPKRKVVHKNYRKIRRICRKNKFIFSHRKAHRAIRFAEQHIRHVKGALAGKPFKVEKWERRIIRRIFGWVNRKNLTRIVREVYIEIPRKNGKSFLGSFFGLYLLFADQEQGAEVVSAAADTEQAALVYDVAKQIVLNNIQLNKLARTYKRSMVVYRSASKYMVLSADAFTKHGKNLSGIIFDELHAQPNRELVDVLTTSTSARTQPLTVYLTTAGYDRNSICWEKHEYARKIIDGVQEDFRFYPVIFAADREDDWTKEEIWFKANPNLGISKSLDYMRAECEKAKKEPAYENTFKRLELNIWTEQDIRWMPMSSWDACSGAVTLEEFAGRECFGGLDLATKEDMTCLSLVFPEKIQDPNSPTGSQIGYAILPFYFLPEEAIYRKPIYRTFRDRKEVIITPGPIVDYQFIEHKIKQINEIVNIKEIAFDRWNATQVSINLANNEGMEMFPFGQGFGSMSSPTKELMALVLAKRIRHGGNRVLRWNASNVTVEQNAAGDLKPSKGKSTDKIDGIVATIMGLDRAMRRDTAESAYSEREMIVLD